MKTCLITLRDKAVYERNLADALRPISSKFLIISAKQLQEKTLEQYDWFFIIGCSGTRPLFDRIKLAGKNVVLVDKGYWEGREIRSLDNYWKFSVNSFHPCGYVEKARSYLDRIWTVPDSNFEEYSGSRVIYFSCSKKYHKWFNQDVNTVNKESIAAIKEVYSGPLYFFCKDSSKIKPPSGTISLKEDNPLKDCRCLITHGSNSIVGAVSHSVPFICLGNHPLKSLSNKLLEVDSPPKRDYTKVREIEHLIANLAYCQWRFTELQLPEFSDYLLESKELNNAVC